MAKKKVIKKKTAKKRPVKKKTSKKKTVKKAPTKKKSTSKRVSKNRNTSTKKISKKISRPVLKKRNPLSKNKRRIIINLLGFLIILALSIVLYSVTGNYVAEVIFLTLIILSLVVCIALFLALISVLFARKRKRK